ncbi:MAG: SDR family oxidoreductase, partial [Acidobacteria bacterium]|nr:SDR family oxidoreductase [Acidobacteriota bacterium]
MAASVIVFGGSRGVGKLLTRHALDKGWPASVAARTAQGLQAVREEFGDARDRLNTTQADVAKEDDVRRAFQSHEAAFGTAPSIVINAAAVQGPIGPSWTVSTAGWGETLETNLLGAFVITKCAVASMIVTGSGSIIHFSGGGAAHGRPNFSAYAASKAGLLRLVETVAQELGLAGYTDVIINAIAPGGVRTAMTDEVLRHAERAGAAEAAAAAEVRQSGGTPPTL